MTTPARQRLIYFMRRKDGKGPIRIGCSDNPGGRLITLQPGSPYLLKVILVIPGSVPVEYKLHQRLLRHRSHADWYFPNPEILELLGKLRSGVPLDEAIDLAQPATNVSQRAMSQALRCAVTIAIRKWQKAHPGQFIYPPFSVDMALDDWKARRRLDPNAPAPDNIDEIKAFIANPGATGVHAPPARVAAVLPFPSSRDAA